MGLKKANKSKQRPHFWLNGITAKTGQLQQFLIFETKQCNIKCMHFLTEVLILISSHDNLREVVKNIVGKVNGIVNDCHYVPIALWC